MNAFDKYLSLVITVAIIAVIVSKNSSSSSVIQSIGATMTNILGAIVAPITARNQNGQSPAQQSSQRAAVANPYIPSASAALAQGLNPPSQTQYDI